MIKLALRSALSDRANDGKVVVVDAWGFEAPRTKDAKAALDALGVDGRALVVVDDFDDTGGVKSFRNLPEVQLIEAGELNAYDVLCNDWIVFAQSQLPTAGARRGSGALRGRLRRGRAELGRRARRLGRRRERGG